MLHEKVLHKNQIETSHIFNVGDNADIADNEIIKVEDKHEKHSTYLWGRGEENLLKKMTDKKIRQWRSNLLIIDVPQGQNVKNDWNRGRNHR